VSQRDFVYKKAFTQLCHTEIYFKEVPLHSSVTQIFSLEKCLYTALSYRVLEECLYTAVSHRYLFYREVLLHCSLTERFSIREVPVHSCVTQRFSKENSFTQQVFHSEILRSAFTQLCHTEILRSAFTQLRHIEI
jgi:hypothetical protein